MRFSDTLTRMLNQVDISEYLTLPISYVLKSIILCKCYLPHGKIKLIRMVIYPGIETCNDYHIYLLMQSLPSNASNTEAGIFASAICRTWRA